MPRSTLPSRIRMKRTSGRGRHLVCFAVLWLLGACSGNPPGISAATGGGQAGGPGVVEPGIAHHAVASPNLHPAMAYGDARAQLLDDGWVPRPNPQCKADVAGDDAGALCAGISPPALCRVCDELPELQACSADARCLVRFSHPERADDFELRLYGEIEYWAQSGDDAPLQVSTWDSVPSD